MLIQADFEIAPGIDASLWHKSKAKLINRADQLSWESAFDNFFVGRIRSRYIDPINWIKDAGSGCGEGFAITSIQCALIEFLAALRFGMKYVHQNPNPPYEYKNSRKLFIEFLRVTAPFSKYFGGDVAIQFYSEIRCGLLHEARTKGAWKIYRESPDGRPIDSAKCIVYRDTLMDVVNQYIDEYKIEIVYNVDLQGAFIRKFDDLATA